MKKFIKRINGEPFEVPLVTFPSDQQRCALEHSSVYTPWCSGFHCLSSDFAQMCLFASKEIHFSMYYPEHFVFRNFRLFLHCCELHVGPWLFGMQLATVCMPTYGPVYSVRTHQPKAIWVWNAVHCEPVVACRSRAGLVEAQNPRVTIVFLTLAVPGQGGRVPDIDPQVQARLINFICFLRKTFQMWVGGWVGGSGRGAQAAIPPPPHRVQRARRASRSRERGGRSPQGAP